MSYATILVNLQSGRSNAHLLQAAGTLAERFGAGVIGVTACTPIQMLYSDGYAYGDFFEQDRKDIDSEIATAEAEFRAAFAGCRHGVDWRSAVVVAPLAEFLADEARRADLVLTAADSAGPFNQARQIHAGDLVIQAGRPVLLVAPEPTPLRLDQVMIAWKDTREARRAVVDALPLLQKAATVALVQIAPEDEMAKVRAHLADVAAWLATHGVTADCVCIAADGDDARQLEMVAQARHADIVVAGAYGHSRVREWALGGVTRDLLSAPGRTALISH